VIVNHAAAVKKAKMRARRNPPNIATSSKFRTNPVANSFSKPAVSKNARVDKNNKNAEADRECL
jgi:hypothetical protein